MKKFEQHAQPRTHAGLSGRMAWQLERSGRVIATGEQRNLVTDAGLERWQVLGRDLLVPWRGYAAVGTGSTAPAVGDTTLDAEVVEVGRSGGAAVSSAGISAGSEVVSSAQDYVWDFIAAYNLTEWGLRPSTGAADLVVRSLFY